MAQNISTVVTRVTKDNDQNPTRMRHLADREGELQAYARAGYSLTHTTVIDTPDAATFVDTLTRNAD